MQPTQQPVQAIPATVQNPAVVAQAQQKPIVGQPESGQPVKRKPTKWWIWVVIAIVIIGGVTWAYFQFLN